MTENLTDAEIIKALECCSIDNHIGVCKECPFTDVCDEDEQALQKHALDLINRQKAQITNLLEERDKLLKECKRCGRKHGRKVSNMQKEIERLQAEVDKWKCALKNGCEISKCINKGWVMNEAYREFASKLKCRIHRFKTADKIFVDCVPIDYIDNTLDILTGGE